jgi:hypothetical protein
LVRHPVSVHTQGTGGRDSSRGQGPMSIVLYGRQRCTYDTPKALGVFPLPYTDRASALEPIDLSCPGEAVTSA